MTRRNRTSEPTRETARKHRLAAETAELRSLFDGAGYYEVRTPGGSTERIFVLSRSPWRWARVRSRLVPAVREEARDAAE